MINKLFGKKENEEMKEKLTKEMGNMHMADGFFTETLKELEAGNFELAVRMADEVLNYSNSIEQRLGVLFLMMLANTADPLMTAAMLGIAYQNPNRR